MTTVDAGTPQRILVVDDNPDICSFMQAALEGVGYDVGIAAEGGEAVAAQRNQPADLLITDIFMPGREGMETIAVFKADFPQTRIIAMSAGGGTSTTDFLRVASLIGAEATLHKPFSADELLAVVRRTLHR